MVKPLPEVGDKSPSCKDHLKPVSNTLHIFEMEPKCVSFETLSVISVNVFFM